MCNTFKSKNHAKPKGDSLTSKFDRGWGRNRITHMRTFITLKSVGWRKWMSTQWSKTIRPLTGIAQIYKERLGPLLYTPACTSFIVGCSCFNQSFKQWEKEHKWIWRCWVPYCTDLHLSGQCLLLWMSRYHTVILIWTRFWDPRDIPMCSLVFHVYFGVFWYTPA